MKRMLDRVNEGKAQIKVKTQKIVSKDMPVFYNPVMKMNRDLSVLLLNAIPEKDLNICDPMAGSGIRGIRFLLELDKGKIKEITLNDYDRKSVNSIKENIKLNKIGKGLQKKIILCNKDANQLLIESFGYDYIDIDPFGTPVPFLDLAVKRISRNGIIAVTATDTSALSGTYQEACMRKYWAKPLRNELMHEVGLRILIRKVQMIAGQYEKSLKPIFSYSKEHYMRAFLRVDKGKEKVDTMFSQMGIYASGDQVAGPMWLGQLWDRGLAEKMHKLASETNDQEVIRFLSVIKEESKVDAIGFYDIHKLCKKNKLIIPKTEDLMKKILSKGYKVARTHFSGTGIRSNIKEKELIEIISQS